MPSTELGDFLRAKRAAVLPGDVGLPAGVRRRTPGLRRAELAALAGVSIEYLTRLEQGRDRRPSMEVLDALSRALRLTFDSYVHLCRLSKVSSGGQCRQPTPPASTVRSNLQAVLDNLEPAPAMVVNRVSDLLAMTATFRQLGQPTGLLDAHPANLARFVLTDDRARAVFPEWRQVAEDQIARLRTQMVRDAEYAGALMDELCEATAGSVGDGWDSAALPAARSGTERWEHPDCGPLRLSYEVLEVADGEDLRVVVYLPVDDATAVALDRLSGHRRGALRAVAQ